MPKPSKTIKLTSGKQKQIRSALGLLCQHYSEILLVWGQLTLRQREEVLAHSPLLAELISLFRLDGGRL